LRNLLNISKPYKGPVIVIVGATASGKTGAAISVAKKINGEIIAADSRTIYRYMDIGTAKPDMAERAGVPHFGLDLVEPGERFTVADFKEYAEQKIYEIRERGNVPIVVGGTGLYIDALIFNYQFGGEVKDVKHGTPEGNKSAGEYKDRKKVRQNFLVFGIKWSSEELKKRIEVRERQMYSDELMEETRFLVSKYGWGSQAMKSNIYQFAWQYLNGELSLEEAIEQNIYDDWHLAKRQITWFKRNSEIKWLKRDEIEQGIIETVKRARKT
jgi:tRNA dimethylallyltransferase